METIEIRLKRSILTELFICAILSVGALYMVSPSGSLLRNAAFIVFAVVLAGNIFIKSIKLIKSKPVFRLTKNAFEINESNQWISFPWTEITMWEVYYDPDSHSSWLFIKTSNTQKQLDITHLDKEPDEIKSLINEYKNAAG